MCHWADPSHASLRQPSSTSRRSTSSSRPSPCYALSLGGTNTEVGLIIGILALTSLAARPLLGIWMDRAGRRGFLVAGAGIYVLASLGYWTIQSVGGLLLWRVVHGIGLATFSTAAASLAGDLAPPGGEARPWASSDSPRRPR